MSQDLDLIVVGGGIAGLTAARRAGESGARVQVLEAAERVGGRLDRQELAGVDVDAGGAWVGPSQDRVLALIAELGLETRPTWIEGKNLVRLGDRVRARRGETPAVPLGALASLGWSQLRIDRLSRRLGGSGDTDLDAMSVADWLDGHVGAHGARTVIEVAAATTSGVDPSELSMLAFLHHVHGAGSLMQLAGVEGAAQDRRIAGGAVTICGRLAAGLGPAVCTGREVTTIRQDADGVEVTSGGEARRAQRAIVALDPVLCGRIDFPGLPAARRRLHEEWRMGSGIKFHIAYATPFWRAAGLSGQLIADQGMARIVFDATPDDDGPGVLVGFIGEVEGVDPALLGAGDEDRRRERIAAELARAFGPEAARPIGYVERDWRREPHIAGCVPAPRPRTLSSIGASPHDPKPWGRVAWAGAESSAVWEGHMDGAVRSAERAVAGLELRVPASRG